MLHPCILSYVITCAYTWIYVTYTGIHHDTWHDAPRFQDPAASSSRFLPAAAPGLKRSCGPGCPVGYPLEDLSPSMEAIFFTLGWWKMMEVVAPSCSLGKCMSCHIVDWIMMSHVFVVIQILNPIIFPWYPPSMMDLLIISCSRIALVGFITRIYGQTQIFVCYIAACLMVKPPNRSLMFVGRHT